MKIVAGAAKLVENEPRPSASFEWNWLMSEDRKPTVYGPEHRHT